MHVFFSAEVQSFAFLHLENKSEKVKKITTAILLHKDLLPEWKILVILREERNATLLLVCKDLKIHTTNIYALSF